MQIAILQKITQLIIIIILLCCIQISGFPTYLKEPTLNIKEKWEIEANSCLDKIIDNVTVNYIGNTSIIFRFDEADLAKKNIILPFSIDSVTGIVRLNKSVTNRVGDNFLLYIIVTVESFIIKKEMFVNILSVNNSKGSYQYEKSIINDKVSYQLNDKNHQNKTRLDKKLFNSSTENNTNIDRHETLNTKNNISNDTNVNDLPMSDNSSYVSTKANTQNKNNQTDMKIAVGVFSVLCVGFIVYICYKQAKGMYSENVPGITTETIRNDTSYLTCLTCISHDCLETCFLCSAHSRLLNGCFSCDNGCSDSFLCDATCIDCFSGADCNCGDCVCSGW